MTELTHLFFCSEKATCIPRKCRLLVPTNCKGKPEPLQQYLCKFLDGIFGKFFGKFGNINGKFSGSFILLDLEYHEAS